MTRRPRWSTPAPWLPLRTARLILRPFREDDVDDLHAYARDRKVTRFMTWGPNTEADTREYLARALAEQQAWPRDVVNMAIELAAEGRLIGSLRYALVDPASRTADFGYSLNRADWNRGYATEAAGAVIAQGFASLGVRRVFATCDVRNVGSWTVMEKLGMRREAHLRQDVAAASRGWRDTFVYALLAEEWRRRRG